MNVTPELDARFRAAALREGIVDVRYDVVPSPVGELLIAATERGLARIHFGPAGQEEELAQLFGSRVLRSPIEDVRRELDEYFEGKRRDFDLPIDLRVAAFNKEVLRELAAKVGRPRAARAIGTVMNRNPIPIVLPCHRVLGANGSLIGYAGGLDRKLQLLRLEGAILG